MALQVSALDNVGVEISGFDITRPMSQELAAELVSLWDEHGILLFRQQEVTPENQIAFSRAFGDLELHPLSATTSQEYPELFMLVNDPEKEKFMTANYAGRDMVGKLDWHMDLHYTGKPNRGALLRAVVCASEDGLTGFIVEDEISAVASVGRLATLNRDAIRKQFETRFTARRMALDYLAAYRSLMEAKPRFKLVASAE